ncbi:hypothetical protein ACO0OL_003422 [Hanseniaspora opuntiae]
MSDTYSGSHSPIENIIDTASVEKDIDINEILKQNNVTKQTIEVVVHHHHHFDKHKNDNDMKVKTPKQRPLRTSSSSNKSYSTSPSQNLAQSMFDPNTIIATSYYNKKKKHKKASYSVLRDLSLQNLNAAQHFLLAMGRDISFIVPILGLIKSFKKAWDLNMNTLQNSPDLEYMPSFYKTMMYIQQQDTKNLYLFWQNIFNNQFESFNNNTINILSHWKSFLNNLNSTEKTTATNETFLINKSNYTSQQSLNQTKNASGDITPSYLSAIIRGRSSEFLMCGMWCIVSMYLTYVTLDALMVRWITIYSTTAAILRMLSISLLLIIIELFILKTLSNEHHPNSVNKEFKFGGENSLHAWIFISCVLTGIFIWQSFWTSFLQQENKKKTKSAESQQESDEDEDLDTQNMMNLLVKDNNNFIKPFTTTLQFWKYTLRKHLDLYSIIVFAVVPVGVASFLTMIVLLRNLFIQRIDVEQLEKIWHEVNKELYN